MKTVAFAALILALAAPIASAAEFETKAGVEVRTVNRAHFDLNCRVTGFAVFSVAAAPAHGALAIRRAPLTLKTAVDHPDCVGRTVEGVAVFYKPKPGFRGEDRFSVTRIRERGAPETIAVSVTVR